MRQRRNSVGRRALWTSLLGAQGVAALVLLPGAAPAGGGPAVLRTTAGAKTWLAAHPDAAYFSPRYDDHRPPGLPSEPWDAYRIAQLLYLSTLDPQTGEELELDTLAVLREAISAAEKATRLAPSHAASWFLLHDLRQALAYERQVADAPSRSIADGELAGRALEALRRAHTLDPDNELYGWELIDRGATEELDTFLRAHPHHVEARMRAAAQARERGDVDEARRHYEAILSTPPERASGAEKKRAREALAQTLSESKE